MVGLKLKDRRDIETARELVEITMTFLELDADYDDMKQQSLNSPTSDDLFARASMASLARNEARAELLAFIKTKFPAIRHQRT
jgi:hypothetical protein